MQLLAAIPALGSTGAAAAGTAAAGSSWLAPIMTAMSIGGTALSAWSQYSKGQTEAATMEANARASRMEAKSIEEQAKSESFRLSQQRRQMIGSQAAAYGAAGVDVGSGSPLDVISRTAEAFERDLQEIGYAGAVKSASKLYEASIYDWAAPQRREAGLIGGLSTLGSGLSKTFLMRDYGTGFGAWPDTSGGLWGRGSKKALLTFFPLSSDNLPRRYAIVNSTARREG